jgi:hypothetical protein
LYSPKASTRHLKEGIRSDTRGLCKGSSLDDRSRTFLWKTPLLPKAADHLPRVQAGQTSCPALAEAVVSATIAFTPLAFCYTLGEKRKKYDKS